MPFSLEIPSRDPETTLSAIYGHARRWAPGLDVPFALPRLRFLPAGASSAGSYSASGDGWTTIEVSASLRGRHAELARVLAHEACHHFLDAARMAVRGDEPRNERLTELAMFVCGLGRLAIAGEAAMSRAGLGCDTALGYMDRRTMLAVEGEVVQSLRTISVATIEDASCREIQADARRAFNGRGQFERMLDGYSRAHPGEPRARILARMVEDYRRDRR